MIKLLTKLTIAVATLLGLMSLFDQDSFNALYPLYMSTDIDNDLMIYSWIYLLFM